tara:strand:+ start:150 stop:596 length:447 start_codon:yes stop_codon:yes gene_type:complete
MNDMVVRSVLFLLFFIPSSLLFRLKGENIPSNYYNRAGQSELSDILNSPKDLLCWNGLAPEGICKTLYPMYGFKCSDKYCAIMIPEGQLPDTGLCVSSMSVAPKGYLIDTNYGTCAPNPNNSHIFIFIIITLSLILSIFMGDLKWITG